MIAHILTIILFSRESLKTPKTKWSTKTYAKLYNKDVDLADEEKNLVFYVFYKNREYEIERAGQKMLDSDFENLVYDALRKAWK
jgi:hypothetical protein